jgi:hypothetical protein
VPNGQGQQASDEDESRSNGKAPHSMATHASGRNATRGYATTTRNGFGRRIVPGGLFVGAFPNGDTLGPPPLTYPFEDRQCVSHIPMRTRREDRT